MASRLLVDIHTHVYLPRYVAFLRSRTQVPRISSRINSSGQEDARLHILPHEPSGGRPVGPQYWDRDEKLKFMNTHNINVSVVSPANPWLDFLDAPSADEMARLMNDDLELFCSESPTLQLTGVGTLRRLYAFGVLPLVPSISVDSIISSISQIATLPHLKGVIMGTKGVGKGLDDSALEPVWEALAREKLVVFLHPHYGVEAAWGENDNGHVLPLALGFPFETTTATTRLILSGVLDRHPDLRLLIAHSGAALPQLSSRLASCIHHDPAVASRLQHDARYYLGKLYYDAVAYGPEELEFVGRVIERAARYGGPKQTGSERIIFGTDHPFFPPLKSTDKWMSVVENSDAIDSVASWDETQKNGVRANNAIKLLGLGTT
ncbi:amidohydrolase 2 [Hysterangium stoloniferum]|nr:amidohydrolase 2 [Hysterangium stoloniferum]